MIRTVLLTDDGVRIRGYLRTDGTPTHEDKLALLGLCEGDPDILAQWVTVKDHPAFSDDALFAEAAMKANPDAK